MSPLSRTDTRTDSISGRIAMERKKTTAGLNGPAHVFFIYSIAMRLQPAYMKIEATVSSMDLTERVSSNLCSAKMAMIAHTRAITPNTIRLRIIIHHHLLLNAILLI